MKKIALALILSAVSQVYAADYWWCVSCGLAYPASQKVCLNKDCLLFRKAK